MESESASIHEFRWLERVHMPPNGTLDDSIALANKLEWTITGARNDSTWCVGGRRLGAAGDTPRSNQ